MKIVMRLLEIEIPSITSLDLTNPDRLNQLWFQIKDLPTVNGVRFFGTGTGLKRVNSTDQLAKAFAPEKSRRYTFADVENLETSVARREWNVYLRPGLLTIHLVCEWNPEQMPALTQDLVVLNQVLIGAIPKGKLVSAFSVLELSDVDFTTPPPSRVLGSLAQNGVVDAVYLKTEPDKAERTRIERLKTAKLPSSAQRVMKSGFVVVSWGDLTKDAPEAVLGKRFQWYAEHGDLPVSSEFNEHGDREYALWNAKRTKELTAYSKFDKEGAKALVFDSPEEASVTELIERLDRMLASGKTAEGFPIRKITLIVPTRDAAVALHPAASRHRMRVVYVGKDERLWDPFSGEGGATESE